MPTVQVPTRSWRGPTASGETASLRREQKFPSYSLQHIRRMVSNANYPNPHEQEAGMSRKRLSRVWFGIAAAMVGFRYQSQGAGERVEVRCPDGDAYFILKTCPTGRRYLQCDTRVR